MILINNPRLPGRNTLIKDLLKKKNNPKEKTIQGEKCINCGSENLKPLFSNNGYDGVVGPVKIEMVGVECIVCGKKNYD